MSWNKTYYANNGNPCIGCTTKRKEMGLGCHSRCEDYISWKEKIANIKKVRHDKDGPILDYYRRKKGCY